MPDPETPQTVTMVDPHGEAHDVPADQVTDAAIAGFHLEGTDEKIERLTAEGKQEFYGSTPGKVAAGIAGTIRGGTVGGSDVLMGAMGMGDAVRGLKEANPGISTATELAGALATAIPSGGTSFLARTPGAAVARLGTKIAGVGEGAGALTRVIRGAAGGATEGALYGLGSGAGELATDDHPLTFEHAASVLSSNVLYGAATGGAVGGAGKVLEIGLGKAKGAIDKFTAAREARANVADDLAQMDVKQLRAARAAEEEAVSVAQKAETEALEATRATNQKELADEIAAFRREVKDQKHFLTTQDVDIPNVEGVASIKELGRLGIKAEKQLANIADNPIGLAKNPGKALDALQRQENAWVKTLERSDDLRAAFAADTTGARMKALDSIPAALERNRALQGKIAELAQPIKLTTPKVSPRMEAIDAAREALAMGGRGEKTVAEQMLQGSVFSAATGVASAIPVVGPFIAPFVGARAARLVTDQVFGKLGTAARAGVARSAKAVSSFVDVAQKATKVAPVIATRVLAGVRFAPSDEKPTSKAKVPSLPESYKRVVAEIRSQTMTGPDGKTVMRPEARANLAANLQPIGVIDPLAADRLETLAARKVAYLAQVAPKRPDMGGIQTGPDLWQPSDMEMRKFARTVAAAEDPHGVVERLAAGAVTPEEVKVMRELYPEMHADVTRQIIEQLPTLKKALPYQKALALSVFTGVAITPSMEPRILRVLQGTFANEAGTEGGIQAPMPQPKFGALGSVSKPNPTRAQERAG